MFKIRGVCVRVWSSWKSRWTLVLNFKERKSFGAVSHMLGSLITRSQGENCCKYQDALLIALATCFQSWNGWPYATFWNRVSQPGKPYHIQLHLESRELWYPVARNVFLGQIFQGHRSKYGGGGLNFWAFKVWLLMELEIRITSKSERSNLGKIGRCSKKSVMA